MSSLAGKVALVTGASSGIGRAIALAFIEAGAKVVAVGRRPGPLKSLAEEHPEAVETVSIDIGERGASKKIAEHIVARLGRLDTLVNNAGAWLYRSLIETTDEDMERLYRTNQFAVLSLIRDTLPLLIASRGSIINISSVGSRAINPNTAPYAGTKAAVNQITRILAGELGAHGIRVNSIAPGMTKTEMSSDLAQNPSAVKKLVAQTWLGRFGEVSDITPVVMLLASTEGAWVTGQVIEVSGGFML